MPPSGVLHNRSDFREIGNENSNENMREHLTRNSKKQTEPAKNKRKTTALGTAKEADLNTPSSSNADPSQKSKETPGTGTRKRLSKPSIVSSSQKGVSVPSRSRKRGANLSTQCPSKPSTSKGCDFTTPAKGKNEAKSSKKAEGTPKEKFSMTFRNNLHNGDDPDDGDSGDETFPSHSLQIPLSDRWKADYNHGVQMPVDPDNLPCFDTKPMFFEMKDQPPFVVPDKLISTEPFTPDNQYVNEETHEYLKLPDPRYYQGNSMDMEFLKELNLKRPTKNSVPYLTVRVFLDIMNELEVECYTQIHNILLRPLHSPSITMVNDEDAPCDICRSSDFEWDDKMVFCDGCNVCIHMSCYGLQTLPQQAEGWYCMKCKLCADAIPKCVLCPTIGGAMKCTKNKDRWTHLSCALWHPECRFSDVETREPITALDEIPDERWQLKCSVCDTRQGACIQCSFKGCHTAFHVTCALRSEFTMRIESDPDDPAGDRINMVAMCRKHTFGAGTSGRQQGDGGGASGSSESSSSIGSTVNENLKQLEKYFFVHADYEKIAKRMKLKELVVSDVYEYWKQKRQANGGKSLIKSPQDKIMISSEQSLHLDLPVMLQRVVTATTTPKPSTSKSKSSESNQRKTFFREETRKSCWAPTALRDEFIRDIRKGLDKDRNCLTMVLRREKMKLQKLRFEKQAFSTFFELASSTVVSTRTTEQYLDMLREMMTPEEIAMAEAEAEAERGGKKPVATSSRKSVKANVDPVEEMYGRLEADEETTDAVSSRIRKRNKKPTSASTTPTTRKTPAKRHCLSAGSSSVNPPNKRSRAGPNSKKP